MFPKTASPLFVRAQHTGSLSGRLRRVPPSYGPGSGFQGNNVGGRLRREYDSASDDRR